MGDLIRKRVQRQLFLTDRPPAVNISGPLKRRGVLVTETMVLIALRQKNWNSAAMLLAEMCRNDPDSSMKTVGNALRSAAQDPVGAHLVSIWTEIRWNEISDSEFFN